MTFVLNGITRCMAPSGLKKALVAPRRRARIAAARARRRGGEVGLTRTSATATPSGARHCEQSGIIEVTKTSSKDQTLQRTGEQILEGSAQDRVRQRSSSRTSCRRRAVGGSAEDDVSKPNPATDCRADRRPSSSCPERDL